MNNPDLPPILNTKEYKSLVEKYKQEEERQRKVNRIQKASDTRNLLKFKNV